MLHNPFFEGNLRIQPEKNHNLINTGPCKIIRHPGYPGMLSGSISFPLALGSVFAEMQRKTQDVSICGNICYLCNTLLRTVNLDSKQKNDR